LKLLDLIECQESTPTAAVEPTLIERAGNACVRAWCEMTKVASEEVTRICTLYLTSKERDDLEALFGE
jgi:hypothetical protein